MILSLHRTKPQRSNSPQDASPTIPSLATGSPIDVRMLALRAFRDRVIYPIAQRLEARLTALVRRDSLANGTGNGAVVDSATFQQPKLQQMCVLLGYTVFSNVDVKVKKTLGFSYCTLKRNAPNQCSH